jgi:O-antigen biosynthesis protein
VKSEAYYASVRSDLLALLPAGTRSALDVGCGAGATARALAAIGVVEIVGIEANPGAAAAAERYCQRVLIGDVEAMDVDLPEGYFDAILFADILEHLRSPYDVVARFLPFLKRSGSLLVSIPNVTHHYVLLMLLSGRWEYRERGIMDETHLRFFTRKSFLEQMKRIGLDPVEMRRNYRLMESDMAFGARTAAVFGRLVPNEMLTFQYLMRFQRAGER